MGNEKACPVLHVAVQRLLDESLTVTVSCTRCLQDQD
jgi:hypothetical protein